MLIVELDRNSSNRSVVSGEEFIVGKAQPDPDCSKTSKVFPQQNFKE